MYKGTLTTLAVSALLLTNLVNYESISAKAGVLSEFPVQWEIKKKITKPKKSIQALAGKDIIVLIDKSGSMNTTDCPTSSDTNKSSSILTRWHWCHQQAKELTTKAKNVLARGMSVVLFSALPNKKYNNVTVENVSEIFRDNRPYGSTNVALAVKRQLNEHYKRRMNPNRTEPQKPLLIAVITDGCFGNTRAIQDAIVKATETMDSPGEIQITFLQVGDDSKGSAMIKELDNDREKWLRTPRFDIVSAKSFSELKHEGLIGALIDVASKDQTRISSDMRQPI